MSENREKPYLDERDEETKTELANRIASQSRKVENTYQHIEDVVLRIIRWVSAFLDRILFNRKYSRLTAFLLAVMMYVSVNYSTLSSVYSTPVSFARGMNDVTVSALYNSDTFELTGLPETVDITIIGDSTAISAAASSSGTVVADLEGLTEGEHTVRLKAEGFGDNVTVKIDPTDAKVVLKRKTTQQFEISYDLINQNKMNSIYTVGTPVFEYTTANVRASKDTLDTIVFVKALIDVGGQSTDFEQDAKLIAYDSSGMPVNADIIPNTIHVSVPVTSPSKTVSIDVQVTGDVPEGMAIASITTDQKTVTIYGPESVLSQIDKVVVTLNASTITKDSTILRPIVLPTGVSSSNINQITMNVALAEGVSMTIENVPIQYRNNVNNYKASHPDNKTTTTVRVFGTAENIANITADNIVVYVDMTDAKPGIQDFQLLVDQPASGLVKYYLTESTYTLNVLGESSDDSGESGTSDQN